MTAKKATGPASDKPFIYKCDNGATIKLPSMSTLDPDMDVLDELREDLASDNALISISANRKFLLSALKDADAEALRNITRMSEFNRFLEKWSKYSGISVGELSAS